MVSKKEIKRVIKSYLRALENKNYNLIINLFTADGVVESPLYGVVKAVKFYRDLFNDTKSSKITLYQIFKDGNVGSAYFRYDWELKDGSKFSFECVDIFYFTADGKIKKLKIIYDTSKVRRVS